MVSLDFDQLFALEKDGYKKRYWHKVVNMVTNYGGLWIPLVTLLGLWLLEELSFYGLHFCLHRKLFLQESTNTPLRVRSPRKKPGETANSGGVTCKSTNPYWKVFVRFVDFGIVALSRLRRYLKRVLFLYSSERKSFTRRIVRAAILLFVLYLFLELEVFREPRSSRRIVSRVLPSICNSSQLSSSYPITHFRDNYFETFKHLHSVEYEKIVKHQNLLAGRSVVFVASCDGLGNRLMGLLSAFLFAVRIF